MAFDFDLDFDFGANAEGEATGKREGGGQGFAADVPKDCPREPLPTPDTTGLGFTLNLTLGLNKEFKP